MVQKAHASVCKPDQVRCTDRLVDTLGECDLDSLALFCIELARCKAFTGSADWNETWSSEFAGDKDR